MELLEHMELFKMKWERLIVTEVETWSSRWTRFRSQSLYRNSSYLIASTAMLSIFGFLYWLVAARLYSSADVGIAVALVSVMTYIGILSQLGINVGIIRYLPESKNAVGKINTSFTIVAIAAVIVSTVAVLSLRVFMSSFPLLWRNTFVPISFVVLMVFAALNVTLESVFIALRKSVNILLRNSLLSFLKLTLVFVFLPLGAYGIFSAWAVAILLTVLSSYFPLRSYLSYSFRVQILRAEVKEMASYSAGNYVAGLIGNFSVSAIPILITMLVGPQVTAHYAVAMSYATLLFSIPVSVCNSLLAEGATDEQHIVAHTYRAIKLIAVILVPATMIMMAFGNFGLRLFGHEYAVNSAQLLSILAFSSVFVSINTICWTLLNLKHKVGAIVIVLAINAGLVLTLSIVMAGQGLTGIGVAWIAGQAATSILYIVLTLRHYRLPAPRLMGGHQ